MVNKKGIPYVNIGDQAREEYDELEKIFKDVLFSGNYIGGEAVEEFEDKIADYLNVKFAIALNSGTDALMFALCLSGIGKGDEVITAPNSFIASAGAIMHVGATPVFTDVLEDQNIDPTQIEAKITKKTRAIMPVHLTGRPCQMDKIMDIAERHDLKIIEDAAQSIGSEFNGLKTGSIGNFGCFSAHPLKNLNAIGDGGYLVTNDKRAATKAKQLRSHGLIDRDTATSWGLVSRMDALQARILTFRLAKLPEVIKKRRANAQLYFEHLDSERVFIPMPLSGMFCTYHTFVIQCDHRDSLRDFLSKKGIKTSIHYSIPIHLQPAAQKLAYKKGDFPRSEAQAKRILTLPINQHLTEEEILIISSEINHFFSKN